MGKRAGGNIDLWGHGGVAYMVVRGNARVCVYFAPDGKFFGRLAYSIFKCTYFAPLGKHALVQCNGQDVLRGSHVEGRKSR